VYVDTEGSGRSQHVPTSASVVSSNYCNPHSSPIYSKLLDDSMSSYDDSPHCVINGALQGPHPGSLQTPASAPAGAVPRGPPYDPPPASDHIPRLHEAHPYWVLEQQQQQQPLAHPHHLYHHPAASASSSGVHLPASLPPSSACWRPLLPPHGTYAN